MADITYCSNACCPFKGCKHHMTNAPLRVPVSMAYMDGTCKRYISWLVDQVEEERNG